MTLGDKLSKLRKEKNYTQEQLADILGVSRQSVSKWESDIAYPETDKLIRISELFGCSLDYLLKDKNEQEIHNEPTAPHIRNIFREKKSDKTCMGMPLWHIGKNAKGVVAVGINATGIIAIGLKAKGVLSLGLLSIGVLAFGMLPIGLIALGWLAIGILAAGCFSVGVVAAGAISVGIISLGAVAIGEFSVGALAMGKYFALGDNANAMIALGDSHASGSVIQKLGELTEQEILEIKNQLDSVVPTYFSWASEFIKMFL